MEESVLSSVSPDADFQDPITLAEGLQKHIEQARAYLHRKDFDPWVIERAIDRVTRWAMPYINGDKVCKLPDKESRRRWIFGTALKAARQIALKTPECVLMEPCKLRESADVLRRVIRRGRPGDDENGHVSVLHAALEQLTDKQSEVIDLLFWRGLTFAEVAQRKGRSPQAVWDCYKGAIRKLRTLLTERNENGNNDLLW